MQWTTCILMDLGTPDCQKCTDCPEHLFRLMKICCLHSFVHASISDFFQGFTSFVTDGVKVSSAVLKFSMRGLQFLQWSDASFPFLFITVCFARVLKSLDVSHLWRSYTKYRRF
jgi:hypothetical protein